MKISKHVFSLKNGFYLEKNYEQPLRRFETVIAGKTNSLINIKGWINYFYNKYSK